MHRRPLSLFLWASPSDAGISYDTVARFPPEKMIAGKSLAEIGPFMT